MRPSSGVALRGFRLPNGQGGVTQFLGHPIAPWLLTSRRWWNSLGATCNAVTSPSTPVAPLRAREFAAMTPLFLLRQTLQQYTELDGIEAGVESAPHGNRVIISRTKFFHFCAAAQVEDPAVALMDLEAAGVVVVLDEGRWIHLRPVLYLETLQTVRSMASGSPERGYSTKDGSAASPPVCASPGSFMLEEVDRCIAELAGKEKTMRDALQPAIARAARWRRTVWGSTLLYAGAQLALISRLTYFDLDWDIMEPVTYCITIANGLLFYLYYLRFDDEHSYAAFDQRFLPHKVRQFSPKDFDWGAYTQVCRRLTEEQELRERLRKWAERH